jgi:thiamine-phosphate pyrophosphorylase
MPAGAAAAAAIAGGATLLQVRAKHSTTRRALELTREVLSVSRHQGIPLVVNDRVDVALAAGADGVHLGDGDLPIPLARQLLGDEAIIGGSAGTPAAATDAAIAGADYLGTGDVFGTPSKPDADEPIGVHGLAEVVRSVDLPVVAIGGIRLGRARQAIAAGAAGVAVISAVLGCDDIAGAARGLRAEVDQALAERRPKS